MENSTPNGPRIAIIGVGLIGGSLARALRHAGVVGEVVGAGRDPAHLREAQSLGVIDRGADSVAAAVDGADIVIIATPVGTVVEVCAQIAPALAPDAVITDVGSVKGSVIAAARKSLGAAYARFVPGHPIAGTERSGVAASFAELFDGRRVILTPDADTDSAALARIRSLWQATGATVLEMSATDHDRILAHTSHLPHMLAYALVDLLARADDSDAMFDLAAGGFYDFTRIASSDPTMWRDICIANRDALIASLDSYQALLGELSRAVAAGDAEQLLATFRRAKQARDSKLSPASQSASPE